MADVKLQDLPATTTLATGDLIPVSVDPSGSAASKNITRENFAIDLHSLLPLLPIAAAAGSVDAITANYTPDISLTDQKVVAFVASGANTSTTPTFSPDGLTARTIVKFGGAALVAGDIPAALAVCIVQYNLANTRWELLNPAHGKYLTGGTNTFNIANGTAQLDVAAGANINLDYDLSNAGDLSLPAVIAGDLLYGSNTGVLSALAKGSADTKLFMNAGATAPEWAAGIGTITATRDMTAASGNVAYTTFGFKPAAVLVFAVVPSVSASWGVALGATENCLRYCAAASYNTGAGNIVYLMEDAGGTKSQDATVVSLDADGMTLGWTKTGSPSAGTATMMILYWR